METDVRSNSMQKPSASCLFLRLDCPVDRTHPRRCSNRSVDRTYVTKADRCDRLLPVGSRRPSRQLTVRSCLPQPNRPRGFEIAAIEQVKRSHLVSLYCDLHTCVTERQSAGSARAISSIASTVALRRVCRAGDPADPAHTARATPNLHAADGPHRVGHQHRQRERA